MPKSSDYQPFDTYDLVATILSGQTTSAEIDLSGVDPCGLFLPAAFTGTTIKVLVAPAPGGTFVPAQDGTGVDLSLAVAPSKYVPFANLPLVAGWRFVKLVSNAAEAADRQVTIAGRPV